MGFDNKIQLKDMFEKPEYSDLTIRLNGGKELHVHKFTVCARNEYFLKLCGPDSHFAESKQRTIELEDDNQTALMHVLRYLYGFEVFATGTWLFWMNLHVTADKYLIPKLSTLASEKFCSVARACESADDMFDIMEAVRADLDHNDAFVELTATMREKNLIKLLSNDRFRAQLGSGGEVALWQQIDELTSKNFVADKEEKSYMLCSQHTQRVFQGPAKDGVKDVCFCCNMSRSYGYSGGYGQQVARKAWISKRYLYGEVSRHRCCLARRSRQLRADSERSSLQAGGIKLQFGSLCQFQ